MSAPEKNRFQKWAGDNRAHLSAYHRKWRSENPEKVRGIVSRYDEKHPGLRSMRCRISRAVKGIARSQTTLELLGMDWSEFRIYIQGQFRPGMDWENYGKVWHIDHIKPCVKFDLTDPEQQRSCFNWSNLQPLFAVENLRKNKYELQ